MASPTLWACASADVVEIAAASRTRDRKARSVMVGPFDRSLALRTEKGRKILADLAPLCLHSEADAELGRAADLVGLVVQQFGAHRGAELHRIADAAARADRQEHVVGVA